VVQEALRKKGPEHRTIMTFDGLVRDEWLGSQLGKPAWHLEPNADAKAWKNHISAPAFVDTRVAASNLERCKELFSANFNLIDTTVTLERSVQDEVTNGDFHIRLAHDDDSDSVGDIATRNFTADRFHTDPDIPNDVADRIKSDWARNFFVGERGDWMIVGEVDGRVIGFLQLLNRNTHLVIDLIAVDKIARRTGIAGAMITYTTTASRSRTPLRVGTQLTNTPSLRLYEALGFRIEAAHHVFHYHIF